MRSEKDAILSWIRSAFGIGVGLRVELLDAIYLAMEQGRCALVVGRDGVRSERLGGEDCGAENFGAEGDAFFGEGDDILLKGFEECRE